MQLRTIYFPPGLVIVLLTAVLAGPTRADLAAWLPLYVVTLGFITVTIRDFQQRRRPGTVGAVIGHDEGSNSSRQHRMLQPIRRFLNETGPLYLRQSSSFQARSTMGPADATLTLSSTPAQARRSWGPRVLQYFVDPAALWESRSSVGFPQGHDAADLSDGGEDLLSKSEHGTYSPWLGLDTMRADAPEVGRDC